MDSGGIEHVVAARDGGHDREGQADGVHAAESGRNCPDQWRDIRDEWCPAATHVNEMAVEIVSCCLSHDRVRLGALYGVHRTRDVIVTATNRNTPLTPAGS